jgi:hypothetical protein
MQLSLTAVLAVAVWLMIASTKGWPVSTPHSIIGAFIGFAIVSIGHLATVCCIIITCGEVMQPSALPFWIFLLGDVKKFRKSLKVSPKTPFFVGHTPMDPFGSYWLNAGAIKNHHVIYSAHDDGPSIFIRIGDNFMPISFPAEPLTEFINDLK